MTSVTPFSDMTNFGRKRSGDETSRETKTLKKKRLSKAFCEQKQREDLAGAIFARASHLDDRTTKKLGIFAKKKGIVAEGDEFDLDLYSLSLKTLMDLQTFLDEAVVCYYCGDSSAGDRDSPFALCETKAECGNYCCGRGAHESCIKKHLDPDFKIPDGSWFCRFCV